MSPPRLPPTPAMSGELIIKDQSAMESVESFALPPAALSPRRVSSASRNPSKSEQSPSVFRFDTPTSPELPATGRGPHAARQTTKRPLEDLDLPPPPTRARKIIQMKPKTQTTTSKSAGTAASNGSANKASATSTSAKDTTTTKNPANAPTSAAASSSKKKQQPSATSAAGRKIARKTAHSLIERRRRSKMNEEFSTLKNMIPACRGQEMHKLAILQAGIDYVNYLEQCITDLKGAEGKKSKPQQHSVPPSPTSPDLVAGPAMSAQGSPDLLPHGGTHVNDTSPSFSPRSQIPSSRTTIYEFAPTTVLPSPALGPVRSPELRGTTTTTYRQWPSTAASVSVSAASSPAMQPQLQRGSVSSYSIDTDIDHEASAALLMLNRDRRGTADSVSDRFQHAGLGREEAFEVQRKMGMSVRDLLIS